MSVQVDLEIRHDRHALNHVASTPVKRSPPFAESPKGAYTHRVRYATLYRVGDSVPHMSIGLWCGMTLCISKRKPGRFVSEPSRGRPMCATCEGRAIGAGRDGSHKINGRMAKFSPRVAA